MGLGLRRERVERKEGKEEGNGNEGDVRRIVARSVWLGGWCRCVGGRGKW